MVTAELAACLPVLVLVLAVAVSAISVAGARVRVQDAAREAARGDPAQANRLAQHAAPGVAVDITTRGDEVVAVARLTVHPLAGWLPTLTVTERAVAAVEPSAASP